MKPQEEILLIIGLALLWFAAALFAVFPLVPNMALPAALLAFVIVLIVYQILDTAETLSVGAVVTLFFIPLICIAAGLVWWIMRLLGFPGIIGD